MGPDDVVDLFAPFGPVTVRRMFGGLGIYADGRMIALVAGGEVFMKADAESRAVFEAAGSVPFVYQAAGRAVTIPYMRLPDDAHDDEAALVRYARLADDAARRAPPKARRRQGAPAPDSARGKDDDDARHEPRGRRSARPRRYTRPPS